MGAIRVLPDILANQIAAGEVVDRPASVVKELVENALDAGARRIIIEVEKGGRALIRVSDNGCGMSRDDALMSIERHATSKIETAEDLFSIRTLGFRGEALPSIASVSQFRLTSREAASDIGVEIAIKGGKIIAVNEVGAPVGTQVHVGQLFFNTPARRKFMKAIATEMGHITDCIAAMALAQPAVHFRLLHNGKAVKNWPPAHDPRQRAADVLGGGTGKDLIPIDLPDPDLKVTGFIGAPNQVRRTARTIFTFVNGRVVRERTVQHALTSAYAQRLVKGQYPVAVLFIEIPFDQVDVNVHPTKHEVRFADGRRVYAAVHRAVQRGLERHDRSERSAPIAPKSQPSFTHRPMKADWPVLEQTLPFPRRPRKNTAPASPPQKPMGFAPPAAPTAHKEGPDGYFNRMRVIGQLHGTYVICESEDGMVLIDQHAAHEQMLYDRLRKQQQSRKPVSQPLLMPENVELNHRESAALAGVLPQLAELGLQVEPFGGTTYAIKAVPAMLAGRSAAELVRELAQQAEEGQNTRTLEDRVDACLQRMACHGAIRAGQNLSMAEMRQLLADMDRGLKTSYCPHGRPTWLKWDRSELEKKFKRIV